jgi:hypothetical protein
MPYTGNPETDDRDAVRLMVGDTNNDDLLLSDAEVDYYLKQSPDKVMAAAACAEAIAAMPRMQQPQAGDSGGPPTTRADHYLRLARQLRNRKRMADEQKPLQPGYSPEALRREPIFTRGEG